MEMSLKFCHLGFPLLERWSRHTFPYSSYEVSLKSLNIINKANIKKTERWREEVRPTRGLRVWGTMWQGFPWVSFYFICPRLGAEETSNLQRPSQLVSMEAMWEPGLLPHTAIMKCLPCLQSDIRGGPIETQSAQHRPPVTRPYREHMGIWTAYTCPAVIRSLPSQAPTAAKWGTWTFTLIWQ